MKLIGAVFSRTDAARSNDTSAWGKKIFSIMATFGMLTGLLLEVVESAEKQDKTAAKPAVQYRIKRMHAKNQLQPVRNQQQRKRTFKPFVASTTTYDSNFLRIGKNIDPRLITGKSDKSEIIQQIRAGIDVDWEIARQHLLANIEVNQNWFQNFDNFDYLGWNAKLQWNWQLGNDFNGEIGYANKESLGSFTQLNGLLSNQLNTSRYFANGGYLFHPHGRVKLGWFRNDAVFDDSNRKFSNSTEDNAELNLQYLSPLGSILGFRVIATDGQFPDRDFNSTSLQDNAYLRMNYGLTVDWVLSSKTRITGNAGFTDQKHEHLKQRNFGEFTARLDFNWNNSEQLFLGLSAWREVQQAFNLNASFLLSQGVKLTPTWQPWSTINISVPLEYEKQEFLGGSAIEQTALTAPQQRNDSYSIGANVNYQPIEDLVIASNIKYENRDSNIVQRAYDTLSAGINMQFTF